MWEKLQFSVADCLMGVFAVAGVSTSYGIMNSEVEAVQEQVREIEDTQDILLIEIRSDISQLRVDMAKAAKDIEWLRAELAEKPQ